MSHHREQQQQQRQRQHQHQQHQANRGILPSETLNALDYLVDRLNASSGYLPAVLATSSTTASTTSTTNDQGASSSSSSLPPSTRPLPIRALLVGTNEGVGLSRSLGTAHAVSVASTRKEDDDDDGSNSGTMSEEVLGGIETVWATLVSAVPPHVMAAAAVAAASSGGGGTGTFWNSQDDIEKTVCVTEIIFTDIVKFKILKTKKYCM